MVKCPKCGAEINYLICYTINKEEAIFSINKDGELEYEEVEEIGDIPDQRYKCPNCGEDLFLDEEEAEKFLRGEEVEVS
jgi:ribosomal protein S27AE